MSITALLMDLLQTWRSDPATFMEALVDPETGKQFRLYPEQRDFVRKAFTLTTDGTLPFPEVVFSAPKKSGKTALAAMATIYVVWVLGGRFAEGYALANDEEQAQGRVFQAIGRILEATPLFQDQYTATKTSITFYGSGASITALANDFAGAAGGNPTISCFDELWAYVSERSTRLWDEMVPPPTRKVGCRLTVTYAGFEGESKLLEDLYKRGLAGNVVGSDLYEVPGQLLMYWSHELRAPWQSLAWQEQMRGQLRTNAYLRLVENRWVSGESSFCDVEWWDRIATGRPVVADTGLAVSLGVDASLKRDNAAIVACSFDEETKRVRLVAHRVFKPSAADNLDLEDTLEATVTEFAQRFKVREVRFDPWQFQRSAQTLAKAGIKMVEYPQTIPNLTAMSMNLWELLKGQNLAAYEDPDIRLAIQRAVAVESARGLKIAKEKSAHKIDVVVALAMAAIGAVEHPRIRPKYDIVLNSGIGRRPSPWKI